jgi:hypothetical protein
METREGEKKVFFLSCRGKVKFRDRLFSRNLE